MLANAFEAAQQVEDETGTSIRVVNLPWLNRVDAAWLREAIGTCRSVVTLDNHYLHGGQGQMIASAIAELQLDASPRVARVGVTELPECGTNDEVLAYHHLDIPSLVQVFRGALPQAVVERRATQLT
jgi:transketolase